MGKSLAKRKNRPLSQRRSLRGAILVQEIRRFAAILALDVTGVRFKNICTHLFQDVVPAARDKGRLPASMCAYGSQNRGLWHSGALGIQGLCWTALWLSDTVYKTSF
jgi:hypothetical protein